MQIPQNEFLKDDSSQCFPVLLVEDDHVSRIITAKVLEKAGYQVTVAEDGRQGLDIFRETFFPIVLTDWMMPEMDGIALCRAIRALDVSEYVFIVFLTTNDTKANIVEGLEAGADDYLTKPFDPVELQARLASGRRILELEHSHREVNTRLKNSLRFSETLMNSIPNPIFYYDEKKEFLGCNKAFSDQILGMPRNEVTGRAITDDVLLHFPGDGQNEDVCITETRLKCADGSSRDFLQNRTGFKDITGKNAGMISVMMDISEKNRLLKKQQMNVEQAKAIMTLINSKPPRHSRINDECSLFIEALSLPCHLEGGDHFFSRKLECRGRQKKTLLSLKDQSGHEVGCILRSIGTDLIFHTILTEHPELPIENRLQCLNEAICRADLFHPGEFFTAIHAEIDHQTLLMRFSSAAHPAFFLIRGKKVAFMPKAADEGNNFPLGIFEKISIKACEVQLQPGDRLLFYTDGLLEIPLASDMEAFRIKDLKEQLEQIVSEDEIMPVSEISQRLLHRLSVHCRNKIVPPGVNGGPRNDSDDDVTLISVEIEKADKWTEYRQCFDSASHLSDFIKRIYNAAAEEWRCSGFEKPELRLRTVLEEALQNAWKHGNRERSDLAVDVRWRSGNDFILEVTDEGNGFDCRRLHDPTQKETILKPFGRGIFLMRHMADQVKWKAGGRHLTVQFKRKSVKNQDKKGPKVLVESLVYKWGCSMDKNGS